MVEFTIHKTEGRNGDLPAKVFLTGGSGFLGAQIVQRLITQTDSQIIVLIRAASREEAVLR